MATARVSRGRKTQALAAEYLQDIFPEAESLAASLPGKDIKNTPLWAFEVKARRALNLTEWLKQAASNADIDVPVLIVRPDGYGPGRIGKWAAIMTFDDLKDVIRIYNEYMLEKE